MADLKEKLVRLGSIKIVKDRIEEEIVEAKEELTKAIQDVGTDFGDHVDNTEIHVTSADREKWDKQGISVTCTDQMLEFKLN